MIKNLREITDLLMDTTLFSSMDDEALKEVAGLFKLRSFYAGEPLFRVADQTDGFYLILEGEAAIVDEEKGQLEEKMILIKGDFVGEEAILGAPSRGNTVVIKTPTRLIFLENHHISHLLEAYPEIKTNLKILLESRQLLQRLKMPWLREDEYTHVIVRKHPALLIASAFVPIVFFIATLVVSILFAYRWAPGTVIGLVCLLVGFPLSAIWLAWNIINWANDYYIITNKRMVWIERVAGLYDSRQEAPLSTLISVGTRKTRIGNILGFADVIVRTYVGNISFRKVKHAREIAQMIKIHCSRIKVADKLDETQAMRNALRQKFDLPQPGNELDQGNETAEIHINDQISSTREINFFEWLFSDFLRVRYQVGGITTYRKHWFMLVKGIWLPFLLFMAGVGTGIAVAANYIDFIERSTGLLIVGGFLFVVFLWLVYGYIEWRNDIFQLTDEQIIDIDRKPFGMERRRSAPLENILSIEYARFGIWEMMFNFGTVFIVVGNTKLTFDHVYHPSEVQQDIFSRMGQRSEQQKQISVEQERERVSEWFKAYHDQSEEIKRKSTGHSLEDHKTSELNDDQ